MSDFQDKASFPATSTVRLDIPRPSFGKMLLDARISRGFSLNDASERTKIPRSTIIALESGDFSGITISPFYCKCYVEKLCIEYDCQSDPIIETFEQDYSEYRTRNGLGGDTSSPFALEDAVVGKPRLRVSAMLITTLIVLILLLAFCGWAYHRYQRNVTIEEGVKYDLPSLVEPPALPDSPLKLPSF
jgi:cytoskeletal protein RodZ